MQMKKSSSSSGGGGVSKRAWNILRLALLWARKGGVLKTRLAMDLRLLPKYLKSHRRRDQSALHYGERELSFDDTPVFHVKMHRPSSLRFKLPHIPCINPADEEDVLDDFDYDFGLEEEDNIGHVDYYYNNDVEEEARKTTFLKGEDDEKAEKEMEMVCCEDEGIDVKAEEFIAKFYQQMKLQRQISYLQYNEMMINTPSII